MSTYYKRLATIIRAFPVIRDLSYCFFYGSICLCFVDKSTRNQRQVTGCHLSVKFVCGKLHDSNYSKQIFQCRRQTTSLILFDHSVMIIYDGRSKLRFFFLQRLQSCAFQDKDSSRDLQFARDSFESRWKKISRNVGHLLRQNQDRIKLCKEFRDDYKQLVAWLRTFENQVVVSSARCEDLHELNLEISRLQVKD